MVLETEETTRLPLRPPLPRVAMLIVADVAGLPRFQVSPEKAGANIDSC